MSSAEGLGPGACAGRCGALARKVGGEKNSSGARAPSLVPAPEIKHNLTAPSFLASAWLSHNGTELGLMVSNVAEETLELALHVELRRMWNESLRNQTLMASRLRYSGSPFEELSSTPLCILNFPCGSYPTGLNEPLRIREKLGAGHAVFLKLQTSDTTSQTF